MPAGHSRLSRCEVKSVFDPNGKDLEEFRTHQRRVQVMQAQLGWATPSPKVFPPLHTAWSVRPAHTETGVQRICMFLGWNIRAVRTFVGSPAEVRGRHRPRCLNPSPPSHGWLPAAAAAFPSIVNLGYQRMLEGFPVRLEDRTQPTTLAL